MNELLKIILSLSLSGSILILALLFLRPLCRNRMSWRWQYYIWLLVIARLLLPFTPDTSVTGNLFRQAEIRILKIADAASPLTDKAAGISPENNMDNAARQNETDHGSRLSQADSDDMSDMNHSIQSGDTGGTSLMASPDDTSDSNTAANTQASGIPKDIFPALCALWLVAAMLLFVRKVTIYQSFVKYVNAGSTPVDDIALLEHFGQIIGEQHVHSTIDLRVNSLVSSPLLIGFRRARIILPTTDLSADDFYYTILHELTHYRRRDMFYKWLVQLTVCLHWFNPFVYLMDREINRLCELSCDERVVSTFPDNLRKSYGDTLLNAIGTGGTYKDAVASVTLYESKELIKERLDAMMNFRKIPKWIKITAVFLTGILFGGAVVLGAYATPAAGSAVDGIAGTRTAVLTEIDTADYNSLPDYTIEYEDDIYYIMVDGAGENDKPLSKVTSGCKKLVLVRKDEYATMGPFASNDMPSLARHVKEQCQSLLESGRITQENAGLFLKAAEYIQATYNAEGNDSSGHTYYFTQAGYYQPPYIIFLGYNLPSSHSSAQRAFGAQGNILLTLSDGSTMPVYFTAESEKYMTDAAALPAITSLVERLSAKHKNTDRPIEAPLISSIEYVGDTDPELLAETYYREDDLNNFIAVFPELNSRTQQEYLNRMFEDDECGFFSCCLSLLYEDSAYKELVESYIRKAYEQDNTGFFASLACMLDETSRRYWLEKCKKDGNSSYYYILRANDASIPRMEEDFENENAYYEEGWDEDLSGEDYPDEITAVEELIDDWMDNNQNSVKNIDAYQEEYNEQSIIIIKNAYYYQNARVRLLMDLRADGSFENFAYNKRGTVDLRLIRDAGNRIIRVEYLTAEESAEILEEIDDYPVTDPDDTHYNTTNIIDLNRLTRQEIPAALLKTLDSCDTGKWYLINDDGKQYIYYNGLPHTYAYEPWITGSDTGDLITVEITDINIESPFLRSDEALSHYVLLSFSYTPDSPEADFSLAIQYNNVPVTYESISTAAP